MELWKEYCRQVTSQIYIWERSLWPGGRKGWERLVRKPHIGKAGPC